MKTLKIILTLLILSFTAISCSSDDNPSDSKPVTYVEEDPWTKYTEQTIGKTTAENIIDSFDFEIGLVFTPTIDGKIKALVVQLPIANPNLRVTIWDYDSKNILRTEMVNVRTSNIVETKPIAELAIVKNKKYLITMNTNDFYYYKFKGETIHFPITAGNIRIEGLSTKQETLQSFPDYVESYLKIGVISFIFQHIE